METFPCASQPRIRKLPATCSPEMSPFRSAFAGTYLDYARDAQYARATVRDGMSPPDFSAALQ